MQLHKIVSEKTLKEWKGKWMLKVQEQQTEKLQKRYILSPTAAIIASNVNGWNISIKRQRLLNWIKNKTQLYVAYKKPTLNIDTD